MTTYTSRARSAGVGSTEPAGSGGIGSAGAAAKAQRGVGYALREP